MPFVVLIVAKLTNLNHNGIDIPMNDVVQDLSVFTGLVHDHPSYFALLYLFSVSLYLFRTQCPVVGVVI